MSQKDPALLWDDELQVNVYKWPNTVSGTNKAAITQAETDAFIRTEEEPKEDIKIYVKSNVYHEGKGPESQFSTTMTARREMYGAAEIGMAKNAWDNYETSETQTTP